MAGCKSRDKSKHADGQAPDDSGHPATKPLALSRYYYCEASYRREKVFSVTSVPEKI
jgi:hypothetical protein